MAEVSKWRRFNISAGQGGGGGDDDDDAKESQSWFTLKHLVYNFWTFVAFDPRDMVFAYYGLLNQYAAERHRADYGMGLVAIYTAATRDLIRSEASLAALSCCVYPLQRRKDLRPGCRTIASRRRTLSLATLRGQGAAVRPTQDDARRPGEQPAP
ncbi:hypothetical protein J3459_009803 [Metarhizium acridum]|nr:hypothetical protein J3459_009803 [Metarhizium acridum]